MKVVILAGGYGTRLTELTKTIPKPMIKIGMFPIIWHIMKFYSFYGLNDFIICLGYRSDIIKNYFRNLATNQNSLRIDVNKNQVNIISNKSEKWKIDLIETGINTMTGGRILKIKNYIDTENFCLTYGDGLSNINIKKLIKNHISSKSLATLTAVRPPERFGIIKLDSKNNVIDFSEKPLISKEYINGGFFVLNKKIIELIKNDKSILETDVLKKLSKQKSLHAFKHDGFWQCMDNIREYNLLNSMWEKNNAPWKIW